MKKLLFLVVFAIVIINVFGANTTYTWNGTTGATWNNAANWLPNTGYPSATSDSAIINNASTMTVALGAAQSVGGVKITGGGTITITGAYALTTTRMTVDGSSVIFNADAVTVNSRLDFTGTTPHLTHNPLSNGKAFIIGNGNAFTLIGNNATSCFDGNDKAQYNINTTSALTAFFNPSNVYYQLIISKGIITLGTDFQTNRLSWGSAPSANTGLTLNGKMLTLSSVAPGSCTLTANNAFTIGIDASVAGSKVVISTTQTSFLNATGRIFKDLTTIDNLEMNSTGTFTPGYPLTVKNLILTTGTVSANNITIASGGGITRSASTALLTGTPVFTGAVNVTIGASTATAGSELLGRSGRVGTLTVNNSSTYTLNSSTGIATTTSITSGGLGYGIAPTVTFNTPSGGAAATGTAFITNGAVTAINITSGGSGYISAPTITISAPPIPSAWAGSTSPTANTTVTNGGNLYVCITSGTSVPSSPISWASGTSYIVGDIRKNASTNIIYICTTAGISSVVPTGTGTGIVDGAVRWSYYGASTGPSGTGNGIIDGVARWNYLGLAANVATATATATYNSTNTLTVDALTIGNGTSGSVIYPNSANALTLNVNNDITINSGASLLCGTQTSAVSHLLNVGGNITNIGIFTPVSATGKAVDVTLNGTSANQNLCAATFNNLTISNSSGLIPGVTLTGAVTVNNNLTLGNGSSGSINFAGAYQITTSQMTLNNWQATFIDGVQIYSNLTFSGANSRLTCNAASGGKNLWLGNGNDFTLNGNSVTNYIDGNSNLQFNFSIANLLGTSTAFYFNPATTFYNLLIQNGTIPLGTDLKISRIAWGSSSSNTMKLVVNGKVLTISGSGTSVTTNTSSTAGIDASVTGSKVLITSTAASVLNASGRIFYPATTIDNLEINTSGTFITGYPLTVKNLILTAGKISTGSNILTVEADGSVTGASSTSYIQGNLKKLIAAGSTSKTFEIGDATTYAPVTLALSGTIAGSTGSIQASTASGEHANIATSGINAAKSVNRTWNISNPDALSGLTSYSPTFTFVAGDVDVSTSTSNFIVGKYAGSAWTLPTVGTKTSTTTQATGVTDFGDFAIGEANSVTVSADANLSTYSPTSATDIVVSAGVLTIDGNASVKSITVAPGAKLTLGSGSISATNGITLQSTSFGTATFVDNNNTTPQAVSGTVEQYLGSARNWYMSSPIAGATVPAGQSYYSYDESGNNTGFVAPASLYWVAVPETTAINPLKGYIMQPNAATTKSYSGTFNTGSQTPLSLSRTSGKSNEGFNLVANPYPSYLDWKLVSAANSGLLTTAWFRTKNNSGGYIFATVNVANPASPVIVAVDPNTTITTLIPPMQAYWVRVSAVGSTTYTVNNLMRAHADNTGNKFKAPTLTTQPLLRLRVSNGSNADETVVLFNANASNEMDIFDSPKMSNTSASIPEIYTQIGTEKFVINGIKDFTYDTEIPIGFSTLAANDFTILANEISNFESGTRVILIDKQKPTVETELTSGSAYNFSAPITSATTDRFSLIFRAPGIATGLKSTEQLNAQVFVNVANQITIIAPEKSDYAIYNAFGQLIEKGILNYKLHTINCKLTSGVYFIELTVNGQSEIQKVIIR